VEIDYGHSKLHHVIETYGKLKLADANEAETRKKVIDTILEDVLGWIPEEDIRYEERVCEDEQITVADYSVKTATTVIVVEAKKASKCFELPINKTSGVMGGVLKEGEVGRTIRQVRDYARKLSIPFAVATNGNAWIIFPAVRTDGTTFEQTSVVRLTLLYIW